MLGLSNLETLFVILISRMQMTTLNTSKSRSLHEKACQVIPGGVNSPVRAFKAVGGQPIFFKRGAGAYIYDVDDNCYIDYVGSWGPLILGHAHPAVVAAIQATMHNGLSFGASTPLEVELAELVTTLMPSMEMVRMTSSGTEATMSAIRLARGYTGKTKIIKFDSCYHGHSDSLLVKAGSGILTLGIAGCAGIPADIAQHTLVIPYNDLAATEQALQQYSNEPIAANNNLILPAPGFLAGLRALCDKYHAVLIFDEVITGFRVALGGAQALYNIQPDITCLGKIIGGGMPVGAFGGRAEIFAHLAPLGPVYQAGTLSGNPIAMSAGLATLKELQKPNIYTQLAAATDNLMQAIHTIAIQHKININVRNVGSLFGLSFLDDPEQKLFNRFFHRMLENGVYLAPSAFEAGFVSVAHDPEVIDKTKLAVETSFANL